MATRLKLTIWFVVFLVFSNGLLYGALNIFVFSEFKSIERDEARIGVSRALAVIRADNTSLLAWVRDVGPWDDTYSFANTGDPAYIANNYDTQAIENLDFDLILFADNSESVLWSYVSGSQTINDLRYREFLHIMNQDPDWETSSGMVGLHRMGGDSVYIIAAHPIQTSEYGGPSRGTTVFGRRLDNVRFEKMIASSVADFDLQVIGDDPITNQFAESIEMKNDGFDVRRENGETKAYAVLQDLNKKSAVLLEIRAHVDTTKNGAESIRYVMYSYLIITLLGLASLFVFSKKRG